MQLSQLAEQVMVEEVDLDIFMVLATELVVASKLIKLSLPFTRLSLESCVSSTIRSQVLI